mgnify:CR=1 FL=1|jgi:hypothetical protein
MEQMLENISLNEQAKYQKLQKMVINQVRQEMGSNIDMLKV